MNRKEQKLLKDIMIMIEDNLRILIRNNDSCLYHFKEYCKELSMKDFPLDQYTTTVMLEECLYALLNADFLYDFRDIE